MTFHEGPLGSRRLASALLLALAAPAACAGARRPPADAASNRRAFEVAGRGALEIEVPAGWTASATAGEGHARMTIRLERPGARFLALFTPYASGAPDDGEGHLEAAQMLAELARRQALATSVEAEIPLEEMSAGGVRAFWFEATDGDLEGRAPEPDEWRHVLQGAAAVGRLLVGFALLDDAPGPQRGAVLEVVRGARHVAFAGGSRAPPPLPGAREEER